MIESTRRKMSRAEYAAMLVGALAVAAFSNTGVASAEKVWDIEWYDDCMAGFSHDQMNESINDIKRQNQECCEHSGGIFQDACQRSRISPGLRGCPSRNSSPAVT
jgi:hypothetical protein